MGTQTRITLLSPEGKEIGSMTVSGCISTSDVTKELRIAVRLVVDTGKRKRRRSFEVGVDDKELLRRISEYLAGFVVRAECFDTRLTGSDERRLGEVPSSG